MAKISKAYSISDEDFQELIQNASSYAECCRALGYNINGGHGSDMIKRRCAELNISTEHFSHSKAIAKKAKYRMEEILVENSNYKNITRLKIRLVNEGYLEYKCSKCGNTGEWNGEPLVLELEHKNGNHSDHRIENLTFLCPNCHSQTPTYSGRNKTTKS